MSHLERYVVVRDQIVRGGRSFRPTTRGSSGLLLTARTSLVAPAPDELHVGPVDFEARALVAVPIGPLALRQAPLDVHELALLKVLVCDLRLAPPHAHSEPRGDLFSLARALATAPALARRDREVADRGARRGVAELRVATEVADDDDLVERSHGSPQFLVKIGASESGHYRSKRSGPCPLTSTVRPRPGSAHAGTRGSILVRSDRTGPTRGTGRPVPAFRKGGAVRLASPITRDSHPGPDLARSS